MAAGTLTNVNLATAVNSYSAQRLYRANAVGVQGDNAATVRAVTTADIPIPKGAGALQVLATLTNAIGGGAGDSIYTMLEFVKDGVLYPFYTGAAFAFNADGSTNPIIDGLFVTVPAASAASTAGSRAVANTILPVANLAAPFHPTVFDSARITLVVIHVGAPAGTANFTLELWAVPYRGTVR